MLKITGRTFGLCFWLPIGFFSGTGTAERIAPDQSKKQGEGCEHQEKKQGQDDARHGPPDGEYQYHPADVNGPDESGKKKAQWPDDDPGYSQDHRQSEALMPNAVIAGQADEKHDP